MPVDDTLIALPYPFHSPKGQELLRTVTSMYRSEREIKALLERVELPWYDFLIEGSTVTQLWRETLRDCNARGATTKLVQTVITELPNNPRVDFLRSLIAGAPAAVSSEPSDANNNPMFLAGTDAVSEPESLLFHDDLTIPTREIDGLIGTLQLLQKIAPSICLLRVRSPYGETAGTGFRIGGDLVLTNEHVLVPFLQPAAAVAVEFLIDPDQRTELPGDIGTIIPDRVNDWAVIRVAGMDPALPIVDLGTAKVPKYGDPSYIIQHPGGKERRLGFVRNLVTDVSDRVVHYLTDTQPGSSGAPVFDARGNIIAIHHAGGKPVEVAGRPPVSKNEGIRIDLVAAQLRQKQVI